MQTLLDGTRVERIEVTDDHMVHLDFGGVMSIGQFHALGGIIGLFHELAPYKRGCLWFYDRQPGSHTVEELKAKTFQGMNI